MLGYVLNPDQTLAVWHTIVLTIESDNTGHEEISRVRPWRCLMLDHENALSSPSKERLDLGGDCQDALNCSLDELRDGIQATASKLHIRDAQLTGGLRSRLVAAFLLDGGLAPNLTFETLGSEQNADVIAAKIIAEARVFPRRSL